MLEFLVRRSVTLPNAVKLVFFLCGKKQVCCAASLLLRVGQSGRSNDPGYRDS